MPLHIWMHDVPEFIYVTCMSYVDDLIIGFQFCLHGTHAVTQDGFHGAAYSSSGSRGNH